MNKCVRLTRRESEILGLLVYGLNNRAIAAQLRLSEKTVRNKMSEILSKLELANRTQAALWAKERKVLQEEVSVVDASSDSYV
jgi:NarL family two-component system response regulator LiaR